VCGRSATETNLYAALGLPYAPPELREGETGDVPEMVERVEGIFHVHTEWSDGAATIGDMARETARAGFSYLGITDHSKAASYANGLDEARLREQAVAIEEARREDRSVTILHGIEVDILVDGALDLADDALAELDFVIASVHSRFNLSHDEMTARIVRAVSHPLVTILGHPTGRLLLGRSGYTFDVEQVAKAAAANDTYLEINANPQRLDLSDAHVRIAAAAGARFAIDPDAHSPRGISDTGLGVRVARRAGLAAGQVLNAQGRDAVVATLVARKEKALRRLSARG
jgi:DNA polymerase (family 10)